MPLRSQFPAAHTSPGKVLLAAGDVSADWARWESRPYSAVRHEGSAATAAGGQA